MPNRILRDWTDSFTVNQLDAQAERFFVRLIMKVDDFGCFHGDTRLLRSALFPLADDLRDTDISRWMAACQKAGLVRCYEVSGRPYVAISRFKQRLRQMKAKFPQPPENQEDNQSADNGQSIDRQPHAPFVSDSDSDSDSVSPSGGVQRGNAPSRKPANVEQCITNGQFIGMPEDHCRSWYRDMEAAGWAKMDGTPFGNWRREQIIARDRMRANPPTNGSAAPSGKLSGAEIILRRDELKNVEEGMEKITGKLTGMRTFRELSFEDQKEHKRLKERRAILRRMLDLHD